MDATGLDILVEREKLTSNDHIKKPSTQSVEFLDDLLHFIFTCIKAFPAELMARS